MADPAVSADEPPTFREAWEASRANVGGLMLLLDVLAEQGRDVMVIPRSEYGRARESASWRDATSDYIVVEDETWRAWHNAIGYP